MERLLAAVALALLDADRLRRTVVLDAVEVQVEAGDLLEALTGLDELRVAHQLDVAGDLEVVLLLADERVVGIREVEPLVGVDAIVRHRPENNSCTVRGNARIEQLVVSAYSSVRFWSQRLCQAVCWKVWNRMHWYWGSDRQPLSDPAKSSSTVVDSVPPGGLSWPGEQCSAEERKILTSA